MNIHFSSVIKAGGIAAAISLVLALLSAIPLLGCLFGPLLCIGYFLIPLGAGVGYGHFAPGKENMGQSAVGGALAGGFGGFVFGLISGVVSAFTGAASAYVDQTQALEGIVTGGIGMVLLCTCASLITGLIFGAIGGVVWPLVQGSRQ